MRATNLTLVMVAALLGCGAATETPVKNTSSADPKKAQVLVNEAKSELEEGHYDEARKLLSEANGLSDAKIRHQISITAKEIDKTEAKQVAGAVKKLTKQGKCLEGAQKSAATITARADSDVPKRLRRTTKKSLVGCLDTLLSEEKLSDAQAFVVADAAKTALNKKTVAKLADKVHETVLDTLLGRVTAPLSTRKWAEGTAMLVKAVKDGEALPAERDEVLPVLRKGIAEDVERIVNDRFGKTKGGAEALEQVDALLRAGFYKSPDAKPAADAGKAAGDGEKPAETKPKSDPDQPTDPVPEKLNNLRRELAMWVTCQRVRCKVVSPLAMWAYGNTPLAPTFAPKQAATRDLQHGTPIWRLATAGTRALVSQTEPQGNMEGLRPRASLAVGWVSLGAIRTRDTSEWLPPGQALLGSRVWGPLRAGDKKYELGTVTAVDGANIQVERLADRDVMVVARAALHFGVLKKGLKVLAFCEPTKQQQAIVESVTIVEHRTQGDSRALVRCLDANGNPSETTHEANIGALRIKPEWLPRRR